MNRSNYLHIFGFIGAIGNLIGAMFIAEKSVVGWLLFLIASAILLIVGIARKDWYIVVLASGYEIINIWGLINWTIN